MDKDFKTVRELIAELQKLDQDKPIWQIDAFFAYPAKVKVVVGEDVAEYASSDGVKDGDYAFIC